jgi:chromate transporter
LLSGTLQTAALWLAIWIVPIVLLAAILGRTHVTTDVALFFSKLAIVTSRNRPLRLMAG